MDGEGMSSGDQADAGPFSGALEQNRVFPKTKQSDYLRSLFRRSSQPVGALSTPVDSEVYNIRPRRRGKCIIINNKNFCKQTKMNERRGTDVDAENLTSVFQLLQFEVDRHNNLTVAEMARVITTASEADHSDYDCFVFCLLTHGTNGYVYGTNGKYPTECIYESFTGDKCITLAGKPKIFIIQACQGDRLDDGVKLLLNSDQVDASSDEVRIPSHADFLICSSTVPGFYSWRNTMHGSWFIQALCEVLRKYSHQEDFLSMMTMVSYRVAYCFESCVPNDPSMHMKKQIPCITTMLTRKLYLKPS